MAAMIQRGPDNELLFAARQLVPDLFRPNARIFWADFLISLTIGYATAGYYLSVHSISFWSLLALGVAACALYRVSLFMHEIVHFRRREMRAFRVTWNVLAGIPMLTPSFFYESHQAHHNTHQYGTDNDGEYLPLGHGPLRNVLFFLCQVFLQPVVVTTRFLLAPLSFLRPSWRQWTLERASSFVINVRYRRHIPKDAPRKAWAAMDLACSLRAWAIFITVLAGLNPWTHVPKLYLLAISILTLNYVRTLAAHLYLNDGRRLTHIEQLLDSTTITGGWFTELLCPVGLRYHALHHLFPTLPYHNLGEAHRRLMAHLPADAPYRQVVFPSYWSVIRNLARNIRDGQRAEKETPRQPVSACSGVSRRNRPLRTREDAGYAATSRRR
jgi:fatty acid desaturase